MRTLNKYKLDPRLILILFFLFIGSVHAQDRSLPLINKIPVSDENTSFLAITADYKMNMIYTRNVRFYLLEVNTNKIIEPEFRDNLFSNLFFNVPPGDYKILFINIFDPTISKSISFNDSSKTISKAFGSIYPNKLIRPGIGSAFSGVILTGDKNLIYPDTISNIMTIEANKGYYLGEFNFKGYIQSIFNDMPNIRIVKKNPPLKQRIDMLNFILNKTFPNAENELILSERIFKVDYIDLAKDNSLNARSKKKKKKK